MNWVIIILIFWKFPVGDKPSFFQTDPYHYHSFPCLTQWWFKKPINFRDISHHFTMGGFRSCILWFLIVSFAIYGLGATVAVVLENVPWICWKSAGKVKKHVFLKGKSIGNHCFMAFNCVSTMFLNGKCIANHGF